ncbi:hypothetical protein ACTFIZ_012534 [Dictyostelium cf. discoideum]
MIIKLRFLLFYLILFILKLVKSNKCFSDDQCEPPFGYCKKENQIFIIGGGYVNHNQNKIYFVGRNTIKKIEETFLFSIPINNENVNDGFETIMKINEELNHNKNQTKYKRVTGVQLYVDNPNKDVEIITRLCLNGNINDIDQIGKEIIEIPTIISKDENNEGEFTQYLCLENKLISKQFLKINSTNQYKEIKSAENIIYNDIDCKSIWEINSKVYYRKKYYEQPYSQFDEFGMATIRCINCSIKNYSTKLTNGIPKYRDSSKISFAYDFIYYVINDGVIRKPIKCLKNGNIDYIEEECRGTFILKETGINSIQAFQSLNYLIYTTSSSIGKILNINDKDLYYNSDIKVILLFDHKYKFGYCHCAANFIGEDCKTCNGTIIKNWIYATENQYCVPFDDEGYPVYCNENDSNYWEGKQENSMCNFDIFGEKSRSNYFCKQRYCVNNNSIDFNQWEFFTFNWKPSDSILKIK